jgi:hypothetical protein
MSYQTELKSLQSKIEELEALRIEDTDEVLETMCQIWDLKDEVRYLELEANYQDSFGLLYGSDDSPRIERIQKEERRKGA